MAHLSLAVTHDRVRVLAADNSTMGTQLLVEVLGRENKFQMISSAPEAEILLSAVRREKPDVAVISARLRENRSVSFDLVNDIRRQCPDTRLIVLLDQSERASVVEAFRAGVRGVFCRTEPFPLLAKCIRCVHQGQLWLSNTELQYVLDALAGSAASQPKQHQNSGLSAREMEVVMCVAEGLTNRQVAERLRLSEHTVKNYLFRIFDKLGLSSRVEVVLYAMTNGGLNSGNLAQNRGPSVIRNMSRSDSGSVSKSIKKLPQLQEEHESI